MSDDIVARIREAFGHDTFWDTDAPPLLEDAVAEIERLRAGWIPVGERLPPLMAEVIGWHKDDRVRAWFRHSGTVQGGPMAGNYWEQWSPQDRECDDCEVDGPTHWMPLPEPPEVK